VGWLQALVLPFSQSEPALRGIPILLTAAASLVLYELSRELFPEESPWTGFVAVALLQGGIIVQLVGLAMVPDGPLLLFGLLAVRRLRQALMHDRMRDWLWSGLFLGLAGLSKYTAVTLAAGALLALFAGGRWRRLLSAARGGSSGASSDSCSGRRDNCWPTPRPSICSVGWRSSAGFGNGATPG